MQKHMQNTRDSLRGLQLLAHRTRESEKNILESAQQRLKRVSAEIEQTRRSALASQDDGRRYQSLILERGKLHQVIGRARAALAE